jgi:hypothetical protein
MRSEEDVMHPDTTMAIAAQRAQDWQVEAAAARLARQAAASTEPSSRSATPGGGQKTRPRLAGRRILGGRCRPERGLRRSRG